MGLGLTPFSQKEDAEGSFKWLLFSNAGINFLGRTMFWVFGLAAVGGGPLTLGIIQQHRSVVDCRSVNKKLQSSKCFGVSGDLIAFWD